MGAAKKVDWFIAIPVNPANDRDYTRLWDMMRYDRCYPLTEITVGQVGGGGTRFIILMQPHRDGIQGGFTEGRWKSFNVHHAMITTSTLQMHSIPPNLHTAIQAHSANGTMPHGWVTIR